MNKVLTKTTEPRRRNRPHTRPNKQAGFSLIEVVVAALILSTGILGVASLQIIGMKGSQQSAMKNQAMGVAQNLMERMRSNYKGVIKGNYDLKDSKLFSCSKVAPTCSLSPCNAKKIAKVDKHNLICGYGMNPRTGGIKRTSAKDIGILVNGTLKIACLAGNCANGDVVITVGWTEGEFGDETAGPADSLILNTRIAAP